MTEQTAITAGISALEFAGRIACGIVVSRMPYAAVALGITQ
jgi:hypothetical protein